MRQKLDKMNGNAVLERRINLNRDQTGRHKKAAGEDI